MTASSRRPRTDWRPDEAIVTIASADRTYKPAGSPCLPTACFASGHWHWPDSSWSDRKD